MVGSGGRAGVKMILVPPGIRATVAQDTKAGRRGSGSVVAAGCRLYVVIYQRRRKMVPARPSGEGEGIADFFLAGCGRGSST